MSGYFACFVQNLVMQLGENAKDHQEYNDAFNAATRWLAEMADRVAECNDTAGDWHTLEDRMDAIKVITSLNISTFSCSSLTL